MSPGRKDSTGISRLTVTMMNDYNLCQWYMRESYLGNQEVFLSMVVVQEGL
jgi:hypothetical protein